MISVFMPGQPCGKGRPRFSRAGQHVRAVTPAKTRAYEEALGYRARAAMLGRLILAGPVGISLMALFPIPKSWPRAERDKARAGVRPPRGPVDLDNVVKIVCDALNGIAWADDAQIVSLSASKAYSDEPGLKLHVYEWPLRPERAHG